MAGPDPVVHPSASQNPNNDLDDVRPMDEDEPLDFADHEPLPSLHTLVVPDIGYEIILRQHTLASSTPACTRAAVAAFLWPTWRRNWSGRGAWPTSCDGTSSSENEFCRGGERRQVNWNLLKISLQ
jgi:hypothetical protein